MLYTLDEFSKITGISKDTLRTWDKWLKPHLTPGGHRRYSEDHLKKIYNFGIIDEIGTEDKRKVVIYARVSTKSQEKHLQNQIQFCERYCMLKGYENVEIIKDIGSSIDFKRPGLQKLLHMIFARNVKTVVVASKDRLTRIGFELFESFCNLCDCELVVLSQIDETNDDIRDIVEEMVHLIHYYAMKLYGKRSYKKIKQLEDQILSEVCNECQKTNKVK